MAGGYSETFAKSSSGMPADNDTTSPYAGTSYQTDGPPTGTARQSGMPAGASLCDVFRRQNADTAEGNLNMFRKDLKEMPAFMPAGAVYSAVDRMCLSSDQKSQLNTRLDPLLQDDGRMSKAEMVTLVSGLGHDRTNVEPAAGLRRLASDILRGEHISDPDGNLARGIAKSAIMTAIDRQREIADGPAPAQIIQSPKAPALGQ